MSNDSISQAIIRLFEREMFYAEIITRMKRIISHDLPAPAGVCIKDHIELHINPELFNEYTIDERAAILKHECEHILRNHIVRSKELAPDVYKKHENTSETIVASLKHKVINIAADCAVNSGLADLPKNAVLAEMFDLESHETVEWYLEKLKDNDKMKELTQYDGHDIWSESEGDKEIIKEKIKQTINKAAERTRAAGKMSHQDELAVSQLNQSTVNWREQLRRFVASTITTSIESSKKKRNRRYGVMFPGSVKVEDLHIGVAIDTSGSISNEQLIQFMSEIERISKYATITVVEADSEIKNSYIYDSKKKYKVKGRGGTAYKPAFDFFSKMKHIDGVIYFGDMDCFDTEVLQKPKYPVLWAIVGNQNKPANFGTEIRIEK